MSTYCTSPKGNSQPGREESQTVRVKVRGAFCPDPMFLSFFLCFVINVIRHQNVHVFKMGSHEKVKGLARKQKEIVGNVA